MITMAIASKPFHIFPFNTDERLVKKALLRHYMGDMTKAELARRLNADPKAVRRLLNPEHPSKSSTLKVALAEVGVETTPAWGPHFLSQFVAWRHEGD